ncbi:alginate lyase family protein [uncultured Adlercreutzia sp.]|uniref:heparinase II/III family protein n=1 Tax=uncultured Adlercreutzia sp. TaxID=875803 RepID=UPI0026F3955D|nr:alginate lyase family protein [uncultured Adlercreutzia sp.]
MTRASIAHVAVLPDLDFDRCFIDRFDVASIMEDRVELLHHAETVDWATSWHEDLSTPLWRFNLHYCEYLLPLAKASLETGEGRFAEKGKRIIESWITHCPKERGGAAWSPYVIALRAVNWLAFYGEVPEVFRNDRDFAGRFNESLAEQFEYLCAHLETDLLANHYFEDLKSIVLLAYYFDDQETLDVALERFFEQVREQILPDGMHFELSPMYHKIILEGILRVGATLAQDPTRADLTQMLPIQAMCDCLYSLERGLSRTPLFNDAGDNVSKGRDALLGCAKKAFGVQPTFKSVLPDAGYAILERESDAGSVKLIFDAGRPGPSYALGHAHCDALSFECFINGEPWIVNGGTNYYQGTDRLAYKRTLAHSTVMVNRAEQHECWASFRVARCGEGKLGPGGPDCVSGSFFASDGCLAVSRTITLGGKGLVVCDQASEACNLTSSFVFSAEWPQLSSDCSGALYSPEFGMSRPAEKALFSDEGGLLQTELPYPMAQRTTCKER